MYFFITGLVIDYLAVSNDQCAHCNGIMILKGSFQHRVLCVDLQIHVTVILHWYYKQYLNFRSNLLKHKRVQADLLSKCMVCRESRL